MQGGELRLAAFFYLMRRGSELDRIVRGSSDVAGSNLVTSICRDGNSVPRFFDAIRFPDQDLPYPWRFDEVPKTRRKITTYDDQATGFEPSCFARGILLDLFLI